jgi:hypothetical protein
MFVMDVVGTYCTYLELQYNYEINGKSLCNLNNVCVELAVDDTSLYVVYLYEKHIWLWDNTIY